MDNKIQRLCKRLNKFTLEEISLIAELEESELEKSLEDLIKTNFLKKYRNNYIYNNVEKEQKVRKRLPLMFEYHSAETVDMIVKCFCADILSSKTSLILKPQDGCICSFNLFFRETLFKKQKKELFIHFRKSPQRPRRRIFFNKTFYFYTYNNYLYISDELLACDNAKSFSDVELRQFKIMYSILCRRLINHAYRHYTHFHIAEQIWRYGKEFKQLNEELCDSLFF